MNRNNDIIKPLSETLHISFEAAEDMLNKLNTIKGLEDIDALSFILQHFEACLQSTMFNKKFVKNYDRLSGQRLEWAMSYLTTEENLPKGIQKMCDRQVETFIKECLTKTVWLVYYREMYNSLPNKDSTLKETII